jgi:hypothetical protein
VAPRAFVGEQRRNRAAAPASAARQVGLRSRRVLLNRRRLLRRRICGHYRSENQRDPDAGLHCDLRRSMGLCIGDLRRETKVTCFWQNGYFSRSVFSAYKTKITGPAKQKRRTGWLCGIASNPV